MYSASKDSNRQARPATRRLLLAAELLVVAVAAAGMLALWQGRVARSRTLTAAPLPRLLSETGLYAGGGTRTIDPKNVAYTPAYALWTDGAQKRRFLRIPDGERIDASNPDRWVFPVGTRFWKEFSFGRKAETRFIERLPDGTFRFATYVWKADGTDAELAPEGGAPGIAEISPGVFHDAPSRGDCLACHEGRSGRVLGVNAIALSSELRSLEARGLIQGLPAALLAESPRIRAKTAEERDALGYLFANCAGCHNADGPLAGVGLDFDVLLSSGGESRARATAFGQPSRIRLAGHEEARRIAPGNPNESVVLLRMRSRDPIAQMPPLGTRLPDPKGIELIERFVAREHD